MSGLRRLEFLKGGAAAAIAAGWRLPVLSDVSRPGRTYSVPVLGDIHFDSPDTKFYHADYTHSTSERRYKAHLAEHVRNAEMWKERLPRLVRASGAAMRGDAPFALQVGDLVQGDCGNAATHRKMLDDAFALVKEAYGGRLPVVVAAGNHDIRGDIKDDGALNTLEEWLPRTMSNELGISAKETTFSFRRGPDVFLVVDFNEPHPDFALVKRLLAESADARYTFVVSHGPVIPSGQTRWFLYGSVKRTDERRELLRLLAARNAIVLAGHTHNLEFYDCEMPQGRVSQFVFNSVWARPEWSTPEVLASKAADYGVHWLCDNGGIGKAAADKSSLVSEYRPFVKQYFFAKAAGHYRLEVSDEHVDVVFYGGYAMSPTRTFRLR